MGSDASKRKREKLAMQAKAAHRPPSHSAVTAPCVVDT
jgi:hypothetical protein